MTRLASLRKANETAAWESCAAVAAYAQRRRARQQCRAPTPSTTVVETTCRGVLGRIRPFLLVLNTQAERTRGRARARLKRARLKALTELMTDGLLRPSEALPNTKDPVTGATIRSYIHHEDVSFTFDKRTQMLVKIQVMVTPIKQYGDKVGSTDKVPVVVSAFRGGNLRSAELLHILMSLSPSRKGQEATTPVFRYAREAVEMSPRDRRLHQWISHKRVMTWYQLAVRGRRCE